MTHDIDEIQQLILRERQGRDRGWWDRMRAAYSADATVTISWFQGSASEFITRSEQMAANGDRAAHRLSPPVIDIFGDRAVAEVPAGIEVRAEIGGAEVDLVSYTRLLYRAERVSVDTWRLCSLAAVYERDTMVPVLPGTVLAIDHARLARLRPTYRWLAYHLCEKGYPVSPDLPGDDRPETVQAVYSYAFDWLRAAS
jgi:SnoaL-like domain